MMADPQKASPLGDKPTVPPKPKLMSKPKPPPKPIHLINLSNIRKCANYATITKTPVHNGCPIDSVEEIILPTKFVRNEKVPIIITCDSINNFEERTPTTVIINSRRYPERSGMCNEIAHTNIRRSLDVLSLESQIIKHGEDDMNDNIYGSSPTFPESTDSSVCSDPAQDQDDTDILEKLSDVECSSERSTSLSPSPKSSVCVEFASLNQQELPCDNNSVSATNHLVDKLNDISEAKTRRISNLAKEIMTSERVFSQALRLLNVDFRNFVNDQGCIIHCNNDNQRYSQHLSEEDFNRILNYLPQLQNFSEGLLADLEQRITDWDHHNKIADVIVAKGPFLKMYSSYIRDFEHQCKLLDEACSKYPDFGRAVHDFEASDVCCKLNIKHYMLKPVQRIPQYRLLLHTYRELLPATSPDLEDATRALKVLEDVATHANDTMKIEDNVSALWSLQRRLYRSHDSGQPEIIRPGRELIKQGELMKLCRRVMQPRYFILLSDVLLYTSYCSSGTSGSPDTAPLRLNTELPLEGMRVSKPIADDFKAELTIRATQRSFTLQARSERERDEWLAAVAAAIDANIVRRRTFQAASTSIYSPPSVYELGKQAPVWVPDYRVTMCQVCTAEFSLTFRRHHCRACGKVVCDHCSSNRCPLEYKKNQSDRVCSYCYETLYTALEALIHERRDVVDSPADTFRQDGLDHRGNNKYLGLGELTHLRSHFKKGVRDSMRGKNMRKPERLLEVCGNDSGSQMRGYLRRLGRRGWFVLKERVMYHYAAPEDVCAQDSLPVLGYTLDTRNLDKEFAEAEFTLTHTNQTDTNHRADHGAPRHDDITFQADTMELAHKWVVAMRAATVL